MQGFHSEHQADQDYEEHEYTEEIPTKKMAKTLRACSNARSPTWCSVGGVTAGPKPQLSAWPESRRMGDSETRVTQNEIKSDRYFAYVRGWGFH